MIGVINYGVGNIKSVCNALDAIGASWGLITQSNEFSKYSHLILPGVGAFNYGIQKLEKHGFIDPLCNHVKRGNPLLGICLGLQLLFDKSYEQGEYGGLGLLRGEVLPFADHVKTVQIPHVGWNEAVVQKKTIFDISTSYYFVHSFFCRLRNESEILMKTSYEIDFVSAVEADNVIGFQFHPEKSHKSGLELLKIFEKMKC